MLKAIKNAHLACTTVYQKHNLPNEDLLCDYVAICDQVDCTGPKKSGSSFNYGIIKYEFDLFDRHEVTVCHEGNAYKV